MPHHPSVPILGVHHVILDQPGGVALRTMTSTGVGGSLIPLRRHWNRTPTEVTRAIVQAQLRALEWNR